jgi:ABC-type antimicrobial peptide transport system permease subunit
MHPLVVSQFRFNRLQMVANSVGVSFEVMAVSTLAGISPNRDAHPYVILMIGYVTVWAMLLLVLVVSTIFVVISRYSQIRERTQEFAILKMLGASTGYIFDLLSQETVLVVVPGTVLGILLSYGSRYLVEIFFHDLLILRAAYEWWPLAFLISAAEYLLVGMLAVWTVLENDLIEALGFEE